jgi:glycosyltransferase involved in cell wall biosynthesis
MASDLFHPFLPGGGERHMYEVAERLSKKHEVYVITRKLRGTVGYEKRDGMHIHRIFVPSGDITLRSILDGLVFMIGSFFMSLQLGDFDVYYPQQFFPVLPVRLTSKIKNRPIVAAIYDVYGGTWIQKFGLKGHLMAIFERVMLKISYTGIVTLSNSTKGKLMANKISGDVIGIVYCGVDVNAFDRIEVKKHDKPRIIYLGRLVGYKHVDDLIIAFSQLGPDAELYIIGEGPEKENLKKLAKSLGVQHRVFFAGFVDEKKKIEFLKSAHVLVLPSTTEGFGIALIEAMASKTPVIAADIPAIRESVRDGETGLLFKPRDIEELKTKLALVLSDGAIRDRLSKNGYNLVRKEFTWDKVAERVEKFILGNVLMHKLPK